MHSVPILISAISHPKKKKTATRRHFCCEGILLLFHIPTSSFFFSLSRSCIKHMDWKTFCFVKSEFRSKSFDYIVIITYFFHHFFLKSEKETEIVLFQSHVKYERLSINIDNALFFFFACLLEIKAIVLTDQCGDNV